MTSFSQSTAQIRIIIAISTAIRTKKNKNFGLCIHAFFHTYSYYNFNPCGIFEKMTSFFSNFQPRIGTRKINGGAKFSEIKIKKTRVVMLVID